MTTTRTFGTKLSPTYIANTIIEIVHFRDMAFDVDERTAFYLDTANAIVDVGSFNIGKIPDLNGDESDLEKALAMTKAESQSNKVGLKFLSRKNNIGNWDEIAEFIIMNYGRKDYLDLRGRLGYPAKLMEANDALAVQLVDYGDGLLWDTDFIKINIGVTVEIEKKNDLTALMARMSALELALEGRLINLPANTLLGRNTSTGTVQALPQTQFATPAQVATAITTIVNSAPTTLDTLNELAIALNNDANFATTMTNLLAAKAPLVSPIFTGFTTLGDNVGIKKKMLTGTTATTQGGATTIAHAINGTKIISITGVIFYSASGSIPFSSKQPNYSTLVAADTTNLSITNESANSAGILSKPFYAVIEYIA